MNNHEKYKNTFDTFASFNPISLEVEMIKNSKNESAQKSGWSQLVMPLKIAIVFGIILLVSGTTVLSAKAYLSYRERLAAMSDKEIDTMIKSVDSKIGIIYYSRFLTEAENEGICKTLLEEYESEGVFPKGELLVVNDQSEMREEEMPFFDIGSSTIFLPDRELSDEEMLQIIDFYHKADYAVFVTEDNEATEILEERARENETSSIADMLEYEEINSFVQIKSVGFDYAETITRIAANAENLYVGNQKTIFACPHDDLENRIPVFTCDDDYAIFSFSTDADKDLFISLRNINSNDSNRLIRMAEDGTITEYCLISSDGTIDISGKLPYTMYADAYGKLYVNCRVDDRSVMFYTFTSSGELINCISDSSHIVHSANGLCFGADGYIYKVAQDELIKLDQNAYTQVEAINFKGDTMLPQIDYISQISDEEFIMFSIGGIVRYKWDDDNCAFLLHPYEVVSAFGEGIKSAKVNDTTFVTINSEGVLTYVRVNP